MKKKQIHKWVNYYEKPDKIQMPDHASDINHLVETRITLDKLKLRVDCILLRDHLNATVKAKTANLKSQLDKTINEIKTLISTMESIGMK